ncbi:MAG: restriction endonuclease subunit S [Muribaculum sp.]|nr:restriction endonuclease subunit S [Muribaculum sp.]
MENNTTMRRLGDYICEVNERNSNGLISLSQGICNLKYFQNPRQVSATPESDKIVRTGQFAYNRATTRNGDKISIALREGPDCTVSSAYCVFYITDENVIDPHWLWLWFKRPDFDRYAIFKSHGSAHEFFEFETMCNVEIPVPPIEEQRAIVARHKAIEHKIDVNRRLIAALEETARTIYRHTFVDNIDPENLPEGWRCVPISEIAEVNVENLSPKDNLTTIDYLDSGSITNNYISGFQHLVVGEDDVPSRAKRKVRYNDIVYSTVRPNLKHFGMLKCDTSNLIVSTAFAVIHSITEIPTEVIYLALTQQTAIDELQNIAEMSKATYPSITADDIMAQKILLPVNTDYSCFSRIFNMIDSLNREISSLSSKINNFINFKL